MRLVRHTFVCDAGHRFEAALSSPLVYGDAYARSHINPNPAFLSLLECKAYDEMLQILAKLEPYRRADEPRRHEIRNRAFGHVADPSLDGTRFILFGDPACPICASQHTATIGEPLGLYRGDVQSISFESWARSSTMQRQRRLQGALGQS